MGLEADLLLDRRRLKRRLTFWRIVAVLGLCAAAVLVIWRSGGPPGRAEIARVLVSGIITDDRKLNRIIADLAQDDSVRAVEIYINSPGGSVAGGESLHDAIARVAKRKPVVALMGGLAASAGYMIAVPAHRIFCREATLTGSIGVLMEVPQISGLLQKVGVYNQVLVSGPLKDQPSLTEPLSPEGRQVLQALVMDMYEQFVGMVAVGRHMDPARVRELADGRAYTGRQALQLGLVDQIGGETEAREWLAQAKGVPASLLVREIEERNLFVRLFLGDFSGVLSRILKSLFSQWVTLDEPLAVWQPG